MENAFKSFDNFNIIVVGDVMIDSYMWGKVDRISPEAPVPILSVHKKENRLGGAANVALNVQSLGANPIIHAIIGDDDKAEIYLNLMNERGLSTDGILVSKNRPTTVKTRILSGGNQMLRVDEETVKPISSEDEKSILNSIQTSIENTKIDAIIFEDYDKGLISKSLIEAVVSLAKSNDIPIAVDPKKNNFSDYSNVDLFKPNLKELKEGLKVDVDGSDIDVIKEVVVKLMESQNLGTILVTLSELGVYIKSDDTDEIVPAHIRDINDVSGAGDTVIGVAALCMAAGMSSLELASISNLAGGLVCEKVGVVPIDKIQLLKETISLLA
ncbi:MAG: D-glycero-beta-D-manno-heptose-7-phosphate kinase [Bacteroidetes bacterium]|nr:MAG: D-glycero-beta-D-manno-heptose-7-phosphate kinase [Bacteroidota bacterium]